MEQSITNIETQLKQYIINIEIQIKQRPAVYKFISSTLHSFRFALLQILFFPITYKLITEAESVRYHSRTTKDYIFLLCLCSILFSMIFGYTKAFTNLKPATKRLLIIYPIYAILVYIAAVTTIRDGFMLVRPDRYTVGALILPVYSLTVLFLKEIVKFKLKNQPIIIKSVRLLANLVIIPHLAVIVLFTVGGLTIGLGVLIYEFCVLLDTSILSL